MSDPLPRIFAFCYAVEGWSDVCAVALAADGNVLGTHISSNSAWAEHDLGRDWHRREYRRHYPGGYELVWLGTQPGAERNAEFEAALALNAALPTQRMIP